MGKSEAYGVSLHTRPHAPAPTQALQSYSCDNELVRKAAIIHVRGNRQYTFAASILILAKNPAT